MPFRSRDYAEKLSLDGGRPLFLSVNIAPTEEVILIAYKMDPWHEIALVVGTLGLMHVFVYELEFRGTHNPDRVPGLSAYSSVYRSFGYCLVMLVNFYILWTFAELTVVGFSETLSAVVVLSFPGALGAAVARLIL